MGVTVALEIAQALARFLPDADTAEERSQYASAALWFTLSGYAAFTVVAVAFASPLAALLLDSAEQRDLILVALSLVVGSGAFYLLQSQLRFELRPTQFAISGIVYSGTGIASSVLLVAGLRIGVAGVFLGQAIGALVGIAVAGAWARHTYRLAVDFGTLREMTGYVIFAAFIALGLSALSTDVLRLLFQPDFEPSRFVVPFSAFAYVLYGVYSIGATGLNIEGRTGVLPVTLWAAAIGNVALNLLLIPSIGYMGTALSTLLSYGVLAVSTTAAGQRYYPVPWDLPRIAGALSLAMGLAAAALVGPDHVVWRLGCIAAYPALVVLLRIVRGSDLADLRRMMPGGRGASS